jgi:hypothetical protein
VEHDAGGAAAGLSGVWRGSSARLNPARSALLQYSEAASLYMLTYGEAFLQSLHQDTDAKYSYLIHYSEAKNCQLLAYRLSFFEILIVYRPAKWIPG